MAESYLSSALSLWSGPEVLAGVDVPADDLGFVAERLAGRERATRNLIQARFQLGHQVIPDLEGLVASDPLDEQAVQQLAVSYHRDGQVARALEICNRFLTIASHSGVGRSERIADLQRRLLNREPEVDGSVVSTGSDTRSARSRAAYRVFVSAIWDLSPSVTGPLPAELHLLAENFGAHIYEAGGSSLDASFLEARPAFEAAMALHSRLRRPLARIGIDIHHVAQITEGFAGQPRARARLLASAACEGHSLVCGGGDLDPGSLPDGARLESLGSHRLNAIGPAVDVHQLVSPALSFAGRDPRWFDGDPVHNLVPEPFRFIGRERELATITDALAGRRLITLTGPPGSGKTRLAARVASGLAGDYKEDVWFVALQPLPHEGLVASTVAEALRMPRGTTVDLDALVRYLSDKHALLILDNCEHVLSECREGVDAIVAGCPYVSLIATSREALHSENERVIPVPPLELPPRGPPEAILRNEAARLFFDRMSSVSGEPDDVHVIDAVGRICRAVEGIPLALVLAAGRASEIGILSLAEILEEILGEGEGIKILAAGYGNDDSDRATLAGTMEWSCRLLTETERTLFDSLSVFRARFSVDDVFAVCAGPRLGHRDVVIGLDRLVQASLVNSEIHIFSGQGTFRLLQPIRDFASNGLASRPRIAAAIRRRHAEHFLKIAEEAEPRIRGPQDRASLERLDESLADIYAAIRWAVSHEESSIALRLVNSMWVYWLVRGRGEEAIPMIEETLEIDRTISRDRALALVAASQLSWVRGDFALIRERSREVLALGETLFFDRAWALGALGLVAMDMFNHSDPFMPLRGEEILPLFRTLGDYWDSGQALQTAAGIWWHRGDYVRAEALFRESVEGFRRIGHPTTMNSLRGHALIVALLGRLDEASVELERAFVSAYEEGDTVGVAEALCYRGAMARYGGDHDIARSYFRDALRAARDAGYGWIMCWALDGLGDIEQLGPDASDERAAVSVQLLAAAEAMSRHTGIVLAPMERQNHGRDLQQARARLGDTAFQAAFERGQRLSLDEAFDLGLSLDVASMATV